MMIKAKKLYSIYKNAGIEIVYQMALKIRTQQMQSAKIDSFSLPELTPIKPKKTDFKDRRLNLLVPSLEKEHVFGGISTALNLFNYMGKDYEYQRIIVTDTKVEDIDTKRFKDYDISNNSHRNLAKSILPMGDRYGKTIEVGENDYFIATAWWTAYTLQPILEWQQNTYDVDSFFYYLIQDYEPGFYPWSSRYVMADSTYNSKFKTKAVFNTKILHDFFVDKSYSFHQRAFFDPPLNKLLMRGAHLASSEVRKKPYKILVYGRPNVKRNCFEICIESLQKFVLQYENIHEWEFYSVGEMHPDIELGKSCKLISLGKLSLKRYQEMLEYSSIGLSLMLSPHPSYPPIEMALYGLEVVTNNYANKNLSELFSNIHSLDNLTPDNVADALCNLCKKVNERSGAPAVCKNDYPSNASWEDAFSSLGNIVR